MQNFKQTTRCIFGNLKMVNQVNRKLSKVKFATFS